LFVVVETYRLVGVRTDMVHTEVAAKKTYLKPDDTLTS
jgi:hypothetical protein